MTGRELTAYDAKWAEQAQTYANQEPLGGGTYLSTRGGILKLGEDEMPGNQVCVIVLDTVMENTFYADKFDPDQAASPICYAFGRTLDEMVPHESMQVDLKYFQPQADACRGCPKNQWGSADTGRGKACQNRRRLALIPAGFYTPKKGSRDFELDLFTDPKDLLQADMAFIKLPVTSVENWSKYVNQIAGSHNRPPHGVITRLFLEPHAKYQYQVHFEMIEAVSNDLFNEIQARHEEALKCVIQGYQVPEEKAPAQKGSLRGLRR